MRLISPDPVRTKAPATESVAPEIDPAFLELPRRHLAAAALERAQQLGATHADFRCQRNRHGHLQLRNGKLEGSGDLIDSGLSVRVVCDGAWGFAAGVDLQPEEAARLAEVAVDVARVSRALCGERVELAPEPAYSDARWVSAYQVSPFDVAEADKVALFSGWSERLLAAAGIDHVHVKFRSLQENKFYADLAGTTTTQQRLQVHPMVVAMTRDRGHGSFATQRTLGPPVARGWEYLDGVGWDWDGELERLPELLAEKARAPSVAPGDYDLVIDPSNLWLTIHESIGHATELDRVLGYEAAYAGTSFATFDLLGKLQYGSAAMQVTGDRTVDHGLATVGYDDEGVASQSWDIIRDGVLVGYQLDRRMARQQGLGRSNGCAFADSPGHMALQRMPNVSLQPAIDGPSSDDLIASVRRGLYVVGSKSWSIDMQRSNFQFTGQRFFKIDRGRLVGQVRDVAYQATTTNFWRSLAALGGPQTYGLYGADLCGKGQPVQTAAASHGCPAALFRGIRILNTGHEAGR